MLKIYQHNETTAVRDTISLFAKIGFKSVFSWIKVTGIAFIVFVICIATGIILLGNNQEGGYVGARVGGIGAIFAIFYLFAIEFWTALLLFGAIGYMVTAFFLANKYVLHNLLSMIWKENLSGFLEIKMESYLAKIAGKQPKNLSALKIKVLEYIKNDKTLVRAQRVALKFAIKKTDLTKEEVTGLNDDAPQIISKKVVRVISEKTTPSLKLFWVLTGVMLVVFVLALVFDKP